MPNALYIQYGHQPAPEAVDTGNELDVFAELEALAELDALEEALSSPESAPTNVLEGSADTVAERIDRTTFDTAFDTTAVTEESSPAATAEETASTPTEIECVHDVCMSATVEKVAIEVESAVEVKDPGSLALLMSVLQNMCEGTNAVIQNYFRDQPDNIRTVNVVDIVRKGLASTLLSH